MTNYCDINHYKAEIIIELPSGGRENRVISLNPPIKIERASGYFGKIVSQRFFYGGGEGGEDSPAQMTEKIIGTLFVRKNFDGVHWLDQNSSERFLHRYELNFYQSPVGVMYSVKVFELDTNEGQEKHIYTSAWDNFNTSSDFFQVIKYIKDALIVYDTTGIKWIGQAVSYRVECFGCPSGEVAIGNGGEDFICLNKNRVIGELTTIRGKTISLMKFLGI